jgi:hypothetical protein
MVGRDQELVLLQAMLVRSAKERRPHLVTVYGEAGVGKSRLVRELVAWAEALPAPPLVLRGRCLPYGDGVTYWPMIEILKDLAGLLDSDTPDVSWDRVEEMGHRLLPEEPDSEVARVTGALATMAGFSPPGSPYLEMSPQDLRQEMHAAWRTVLSQLAESSPVLTVIEDIHWGDDALLDLLEDLAERTEGALILLCPSRPELVARRPAWGGGRRNASAIGLEPLTEADARRLTGLLLDVDDLPDAVRSRILERAEGNPFFLEEILRQLIDEGRIARDGERWRAGPTAADVEIPDSVQSVLAARIDLLPAASKRVLQHAAVVGRVFWTGPLGDGDADDLDAQLDLLEGRDLISTRLRSAFRGERECIFRHVLTCDVAYASIPRRVRGDLHARVAAWLDDVATGREREFAELLAHHWTEAHHGAVSAIGTDEAEIERRRSLAFTWCLAAADETRRRAAAARSRLFAQRALSLAVSADEVGEACLALGEAHNLIGDGSPALTAFRRGAEALLEAGTGDPLRTAYLCARICELVARWPGSLTEPYDMTGLRAFLDRGLALAGEGDSEARARLLVSRSMWDWGVRASVGRSDELESRQREVDGMEAAEIAVRLGLADVESGALDALTGWAGDRRALHHALEITDRRLALLPRLHDPQERGDAVCMAALVRFELGAYSDAVVVASRSEVDTNHWASVVHALTWRASGNLLLGRWEDVLADLALAIAGLEGAGLTQPSPYGAATWNLAAYVHAARGEREEAERLLATLPAQAGPDGTAPSSANTLGLTLVRLGRFDTARRRLAAVPGGMVTGETLGSLAHLDLAAATGDWDMAEAVITSRLVTPEPEGPPRPRRACAAELRGRRARADGDLDTARIALTEALELWSPTGAIWPAARVELALAQVTQVLDPSAAVAHAQRARAVFAQVGAQDELRGAEALVDG